MTGILTTTMTMTTCRSSNKLNVIFYSVMPHKNRTRNRIRSKLSKICYGRTSVQEVRSLVGRKTFTPCSRRFLLLELITVRQPNYMALIYEVLRGSVGIRPLDDEHSLFYVIISMCRIDAVKFLYGRNLLSIMSLNEIACLAARRGATEAVTELRRHFCAELIDWVAVYEAAAFTVTDAPFRLKNICCRLEVFTPPQPEIFPLVVDLVDLRRLLRNTWSDFSKSPTSALEHIALHHMPENLSAVEEVLHAYLLQFPVLPPETPHTVLRRAYVSALLIAQGLIDLQVRTCFKFEDDLLLTPAFLAGHSLLRVNVFVLQFAAAQRMPREIRERIAMFLHWAEHSPRWREWCSSEEDKSTDPGWDYESEGWQAPVQEWD